MEVLEQYDDDAWTIRDLKDLMSIILIDEYLDLS